VCAINVVAAFAENDDDEEEAAAASFLAPARSPSGRVRKLTFAAPLALEDEVRAVLRERLRPVTLATLLDAGATEFAWIKPQEALPGLSAASVYAGAFAFFFKQPLSGFDGETSCRQILFPVAEV